MITRAEWRARRLSRPSSNVFRRMDPWAGEQRARAWLKHQPSEGLVVQTLVALMEADTRPPLRPAQRWDPFSRSDRRAWERTRARRDAIHELFQYDRLTAAGVARVVIGRNPGFDYSPQWLADARFPVCEIHRVILQNHQPHYVLAYALGHPRLAAETPADVWRLALVRVRDDAVVQRAIHSLGEGLGTSDIDVVFSRGDRHVYTSLVLEVRRGSLKDEQWDILLDSRFDREAVARSPWTPEPILLRLAHHPDSNTRRMVALNPSASDEVRVAVALNG